MTHGSATAVDIPTPESADASPSAPQPRIDAPEDACTVNPIDRIIEITPGSATAMLESRRGDCMAPHYAKRCEAIAMSVAAGAGGFVQQRLSTTPHHHDAAACACGRGG